MKRRTILAALGGTASAWPLVTRAQQGVRRIGVLMNFAQDNPVGQARLTTFVQRLKELGWIDGGNVRLDLRWAGPSRPIIPRDGRALGEPARGRTNARPMVSVAYQRNRPAKSQRKIVHIGDLLDRFRGA